MLPQSRNKCCPVGQQKLYNLTGPENDCSTPPVEASGAPPVYIAILQKMADAENEATDCTTGHRMATGLAGAQASGRLLAEI